MNRSQRCNLFRCLGGLALGFIVTSVAIDRIIAAVRLPDVPGTINGPARRIQALADLDRDPDVVFVGCSYSAFGINPAVADEECGRRGSPQFSFNLSSGGTVALTQTRVCEEALASAHAPKVICYELSPGILNSRETSLVYGVRSIGGLREASILWREEPDYRSDAVLAAAFAGSNQWSDIRTAVAATLQGARLDQTKYCTSPAGWMEWLGGRDRREAAIQHAIAWRHYYWGEYRIDDFMLDAVRRAMQLAREANAQIMFYEVPMSTAWERIIDDSIRARYDAAIEQLVSEGMPRPWSPPAGLFDDGDFFDADHMMPSGAEKFSRAIAAPILELRAASVGASQRLAG